MIQLCDLETVDVIVTDAQTPVEMVKEIQARGVTVILAGNEQRYTQRHK